MCANDLRSTLQNIMLIAAALMWAHIAEGYPVGPPLSVEKLTAEADIIFKGTAVSSGPTQDEWFKPCSDFVVQETQFRVISVIKGDQPGESLRFRHYDESLQSQGHMFQPQYYHFQSNRTYVVFAKRSEDPATYRQLMANHTSKEDQGVLLCSSDQTVTAQTVKDVLWNELTLLMKDTDASNVTYAAAILILAGRQPKG